MFRKPVPRSEKWTCSRNRADICGIVPDMDAGGVLTQPWTLLDTNKTIIPKDVYATRPFYFGGSNIRFYDQNADNLHVKYGVKKGNNKTVMDFAK